MESMSDLINALPEITNNKIVRRTVKTKYVTLRFKAKKGCKLGAVTGSVHKAYLRHFLRYRSLFSNINITTCNINRDFYRVRGYAVISNCGG